MTADHAYNWAIAYATFLCTCCAFMMFMLEGEVAKLKRRIKTLEDAHGQS